MTKENDNLKAVAEKLREIIKKDLPKAIEQEKYGGLLYTLHKPVTGVFVSKNHVSLEFSNGAKFKDPNNYLQGTGKGRRHLKFAKMSDVKVGVIKGFLKQGVKFDR